MSNYSGLLSQLSGENTGFTPSDVLDEKIDEGKEYAKELVEGTGSILTTRAAEGALKALYKGSNLLQNVGLKEEDIAKFTDAIKTGDPGTIVDALGAAGKKITKQQAQKIVARVRNQIDNVKTDTLENPAQPELPSLAEPDITSAIPDSDFINLGAKSMNDLTGDETLSRLTSAAQRVAGGAKTAVRGLAEPGFDDAAETLAKSNYLDPSKLAFTPTAKPIDTVLEEDPAGPTTQEASEFLNPQQSAESIRIQTQRAEQFATRRAEKLAAQRANPKPAESNAGAAARQEASDINEASVPESVRINPADQTGGINPEDLPEDAGFQRGSARISAKTDVEPAEPENPFSIKRFATPEPPEEPTEEFSDLEQLGRIKSKMKGLDRETRKAISDKALEGEDPDALGVDSFDKVPKRIADRIEDLTEQTQARKAELDKQQPAPEPEPKDEEDDEEPEGFGGAEEEDEELEQKATTEATQEESNVSNELSKGADEVEDTAKTGIKAFEDVTKGIAEDPVDDFDPLSIGLQAVAGLGALAAGAFIKSRKPKFVKPPDITPPTSVGVELGGGLD